MTIYKKSIAKYGKRIRQTGLVIRKKSFSTTDGFRSCASSYLLDESKVSYVSPEATLAKGGEFARDYLRKVLLGEAPLRPGIDYVPGASKVWSFGYVNHPIYRSEPNPLALSDKGRLGMVVDAWCEDRKKSKVIAHHLVFSLDTRLAGALKVSPATKRLSLDELLLGCVCNAMFEYQAKFYPREQLGFLVGIHHDKHHPHAHVLVHPMTSGKRRVNLSTNENEDIDGKKVNVQYQSHLKTSFKRQTDALSVLSLKTHKPFTWIGREPDEDDIAVAREEMVLVGLASLDVNIDPLSLPSDPADASLVRQSAWLEARRRLLALPGYRNIIQRTRIKLSHQVEELMAAGTSPRPEALAFADAEAKLRYAATEVDEAGEDVASLFGEMESQPDRPGPILKSGVRVPLSRTSAFPALRERERDTLPSSLTAVGFLRRRTSQHEGWINRLWDSVITYHEAGQKYAQVEQAQHLRLADSASILLDYSAEVTKRIPDYLREPAVGSVRVPDEHLLPDRVANRLRELSVAEGVNFRIDGPTPAETPSAHGVAIITEDKAGLVIMPAPEVEDYVLGPAESILAMVGECAPEPPAVWRLKTMNVVTPDI